MFFYLELFVYIEDLLHRFFITVGGNLRHKVIHSKKNNIKLEHMSNKDRNAPKKKPNIWSGIKR